MTSEVTLPGGAHQFPYKQEAAHAYNFVNSAGLAYEAAAVSDAIRAGEEGRKVVSAWHRKLELRGGGSATGSEN